MTHTIISDCTGCTACVMVCPVAAITGERKSLHVINPQTCIDCGACGRICPYQAIMDGRGKMCQMVKRSLWQQPVVSQPNCVSCGVCIQVCPTSVLDFAERVDHQVHLFPYLKDEKNCIGCSFCEAACPTAAIHMELPVMH
ncbi:MAG: hypothetical protein FD147_2176 [Chloroflexi bacterium]|nr:MAG: hypothetical protein FD147_2176 [Chloroflexota bacterium]MBA4375939.1 hydrogenase [Anaerolinea sp.]